MRPCEGCYPTLECILCVTTFPLWSTTKRFKAITRSLAFVASLFLWHFLSEVKKHPHEYYQYISTANNKNNFCTKVLPGILDQCTSLKSPPKLPQFMLPSNSGATPWGTWGRLTRILTPLVGPVRTATALEQKKVKLKRLHCTLGPYFFLLLSWILKQGERKLLVPRYYPCSKLGKWRNAKAYSVKYRTWVTW